MTAEDDWHRTLAIAVLKQAVLDARSNQVHPHTRERAAKRSYGVKSARHLRLLTQVRGYE